MTDKTTKLLLALIAVGLWLNLAITLIHPPPIAAQSSRVESILMGIEMKVRSIDGSLETLKVGTCLNDKIC